MGAGREERISDEDRQAVVGQLRTFTGEGRLTLDEFSERVDAVFRAQTRADVEPALDGLPATVESILPSAPESPTPPPPAPYEGGSHRWVVSVMGSATRRGRWRIAHRTTVVSVMGSAHLDLRRAEYESPLIDIRCWAVMGGIDVIVPEGTPVDFDGFVLMGGRDERVADLPPRPGAPTVRVRGYGLWGGVTVRSKPLVNWRRRIDKSTNRSSRDSHRRSHEAPTMLPPAVPAPPPPPPPPPPPMAMRRQPIPTTVRPPSPPPPATDDAGGTLSIVATDIVGSTAIAEALGDQGWLQVLRAHNDAVREQLVSHHGTEVKQSGDGFLGTFRSARDAVRAAVAIREAVSRLELPDDTAPLRLRVGVHAGELEHDGHDVYGVNVSTACRIASVAEPGEILVSGVVRELAASTSDLSFGLGREVRLAGRAYPIKVHPTLA